VCEWCDALTICQDTYVLCPGPEISVCTSAVGTWLNSAANLSGLIIGVIFAFCCLGGCCVWACPRIRKELKKRRRYTTSPSGIVTVPAQGVPSVEKPQQPQQPRYPEPPYCEPPLDFPSVKEPQQRQQPRYPEPPYREPPLERAIML